VFEVLAIFVKFNFFIKFADLVPRAKRQTRADTAEESPLREGAADKDVETGAPSISETSAARKPAGTLHDIFFVWVSD
jgi:hypothetical protein